mgnify:CR=1 FL=1
MRVEAEGSIDTVNALLGLGACYRELNELEKALEVTSQAFERVTSKYGKGHALTCNSLNALGLVYKAKQEFETAEKCFRE